MEWSRIDIEYLDGNRSFTDELETFPLGLDGNAETSHREFLASTEIFSELRNEHSQFLNSNVNNPEKSRGKSRQLHSLSDVVDFFDGEWNQSEILLPIETTEPEKIILERAESVNNEYIRLIIPQIFGGVVNTFVLPDGINIHSVKWEQGKLKLFIEN